MILLYICLFFLMYFCCSVFMEIKLNWIELNWQTTTFNSFDNYSQNKTLQETVIDPVRYYHCICAWCSDKDISLSLPESSICYSGHLHNSHIKLSMIFKGIVSNSNNIILSHESEDINKKSLFPKFQLIPILRFQVMHDYVWVIAPIDYCVK